MIPPHASAGSAERYPSAYGRCLPGSARRVHSPPHALPVGSRACGGAGGQSLCAQRWPKPADEQHGHRLLRIPALRHHSSLPEIPLHRLCPSSRHHSVQCGPVHDADAVRIGPEPFRAFQHGGDQFPGSLRLLHPRFHCRNPASGRVYLPGHLLEPPFPAPKSHVGRTGMHLGPVRGPSAAEHSGSLLQLGTPLSLLHV